MAEDFDYIIVGGGSAGCVLGARLSEQRHVRVLLLESGARSTRPELSLPVAWPTLQGTEVDYAYNTVPQPGTNDSVHAWPRGHTLGGSSSINAMVFLRGHRNDFDQWARAGCSGWDYESVLPYFCRTESVVGGESGFRGMSGPMHPAIAQQPNPISELLIEAATAAGYPTTTDFNGSVQEGAGWHDLSITGGRRQSAADAYLDPVSETRPNLVVSTSSRARRLLFDSGRCVGVEFMRGAELVRAHASAEVILSAGAVDSPRLLLLSGVGPADELRRARVDVVHDLPGVGGNLHDHPLCSVVYESALRVPGGVANHSETSMLWRSDPALPGPDMQMMFIHAPYHPPWLEAPDNSFTFAIATVPESRGTLRIISPDPSAPPLIDPNYLGTESDRRRLAHGIEVARSLAATRPFAPWRAREVLPGDEIRDDAGLRRYVARGTSTYFHPVGTCRMGSGRESVVAPDLRVHGLRGLRVVDASIMPTVVCVNTNAATLMIAEKAADMIAGRA
ncbi:MAG TPA: GMC family oxidoreductase N-terminal domain-containing protein [Polyangiales bacterium]|nr:GMC family oxidoreductase N-terminal domain-containing protein [Polyangiales bacterium]